jgi:hypothetical protein
MDAAYAWGEDQQEEHRFRFNRFLGEQRKIWTPSHVFNRCCVRWLADGDFNGEEDFDGYSSGDSDYYDSSFRNGCKGGSRCTGDHPKITLSFDRKQNVTLATISHQLDPFCNYFSQRCAEETARPQSAMVYKLGGFLRPNLTKLQENFSSHLITVSRKAVASSDRAQAKMQERIAKRVRIEQPVFDRLEEVIDIALLHRLASDLDPISILCMSRTCRMFLKKARQIASQRLRSTRLSITPLVDGMEQHGQSKMNGYDSERFERSGDDCIVWRYDKRNMIDLVFAEQDDENGVFCPTDQDTSSSTFSWKSNILPSRIWRQEEDDDYSRMGCDDNDYVGQHFKLYWHPDPHDGVEVPKRNHGNHQLPSLGVFVGKVDLGITPPEGVTRKRLEVKCGRSNAETAYIEYEVLRSSEREIEMDDTSDDEIESDESEEDNTHGESKEEHFCHAKDERSTQSRKMYEFAGQASFKRLKINFSTLLSIVALQHLNKLKGEYDTIMKTRPLRPAEVEMMAVVQKAALG